MAPSGQGAQPETPPYQERLQSVAHSPVQLQTPTSGTILPGNTAYDLTQPEVIAKAGYWSHLTAEHT